ncbi:hypothetical protein Nepgr_025907 [Nepenthes gracilis]|uniref:FRIGIDA-like protein n=1 Tax=Nepenthes gracilis TaxID=150966 RepID=A0AAD3T7Y0_NEPGR|nr:hypothetical protein Nepgr_025907 [Nepenthes gracilis]
MNCKEMAATSQIVDINPASSVELIPSLIEQLGKAFLVLEAHRDASEDKVHWNEIEEHFHYLESTLRKKFEEIEVKEKEFTHRESEIRQILTEREAAVAAKEQELLDRVQELKDAAVAAVMEARAIHMPESLEPSGGADGNEHKVSSSLDDENASTDVQEEKSSPNRGGENTESVTGEVNPRPELVQFCEQMDAKGLLNFTTENQKNLSAIRKELCVALHSASEPARLVLDSLEGSFPSAKTTPQVDNNGDVTLQGDKGDTALKGTRQSCLMFMEALAALLAKADPDADTLLSPETKQQAKAIADEWKPNLAGGGTDAATNGSSLEAEAFLRLLATFRIASEFDDEELCELVLAVAHRRQAPELFRSLGLTNKAQGIVDTLIGLGKQIDAVHFIQAFELSETYPPVPLLKTYLKDVRRNSQRKVGSSGGVAGTQIDGNALELTALRAIIRCIKEYKLEDSYPLDPLQIRVSQLEKAKSEKRRVGEAGKQYHLKKPRADGGFHGHRGRGGGPTGGGRQPPPYFTDRAAAYAGMPDRYPHAVANTFNYPVPSQPAYASQAGDQRSYYYPQDDRAAAPYSAGAPNYGGYMGASAQPSHQPFM